MKLFEGCEVSEVAKYLVENPEIYNQGREFLIGLHNRVGGLEEDLAFFDQAHEMALEGDYFVFRRDDTWAERTGDPGNGYCLYQKVEDKLVGVEDKSSWHGVFNLDILISLIGRKEIKKIFTKSFEGTYCGLEQQHMDDDGDWITYHALEDGEKDDFEEAGIEVEILQG